MGGMWGTKVDNETIRSLWRNAFQAGLKETTDWKKDIGTDQWFLKE